MEGEVLLSSAHSCKIMEFNAFGINTGIENGFRDLRAQSEQEGVRTTFLVLLFYHGGSAIGTTVERAQTLDRTAFDCQPKNVRCLILKKCA